MIAEKKVSAASRGVCTAVFDFGDELPTEVNKKRKISHFYYAK